jgi:NNP family nitrate/nitrite transporter-like MFS transporter
MAKVAGANGGQNSQSKTVLLITTLGLVVNFWAWSLLAPLGAKLQDELMIGSLSLAVLLAVPVIFGSIGRIPLGVLTDKYGGRKVFAFACLFAVLPVVALAFCSNINQFLLTATLLGISGATFAIGVPFVSAWFPSYKRGFAIGVYSMGNAGTAVSGFLTPRIDVSLGRKWVFFLVAIALLTMFVLFITKTKDAPGWKPAKNSAIKRFSVAVKNKITWDLSLIYIITFGAFVAFGVYLPVLLKVSYNLSITDSASRAAGFILLATLARPIGGWLSDKFDGKIIIKIVLFMVSILAVFITISDSLAIQTTIGYLSLAFFLGCGNGAVFALVGKLSKPDNIGSITGIVGALGGLGGFFPPLVMGLTYQQTKSYDIALWLLAGSALFVLIYINNRFKNKIYSKII